MKYKYTLTHRTDPEKEKLNVHVHKQSENDIDYVVSTKIEGRKYCNVTLHDDGNGIEVFTNTNDIYLHYDELVELYVALNSVMRETGYTGLKVKR